MQNVSHDFFDFFFLKCRGEHTFCWKFHACLVYLNRVLKIQGSEPLFLEILLEKNILF